MAKKAWMERNKRKAKTVAKYAAKRAELKASGDYEALAKLRVTPARCGWLTVARSPAGAMGSSASSACPA